MKQALPVLALLLLTGMAVGQMTSTGSGTWNDPTWVSNFPHALVSGDNVNLWHQIPGSASYVSTSPLRTIAVGSGKGYTWNPFYANPKNTWVYHPEWTDTLGAAQYGLNGYVYLLAEPQPCNGTGYNLEYWNGVKRTTIAGCYISFSISETGYIIAVDGARKLWGFPNWGTGGNASRVAIATPGKLGVISSCSTSVADAGVEGYMVVTTDNAIWQWDGSAWTQQPGAALSIACGGDTNPYAVGTDHNPYHWNGTGWDRVAGPSLNMISASGLSSDVWGTYGNNIYKFNENGLQFSRTFSGSVACGPGVPQAECETFIHTTALQIQAGGVNGPPAVPEKWNGNGLWSVTAYASMDLDNCLLADAPPGPCGVAESEGNMMCSGGGSNNDQPGQNGPGMSIDVISFVKAVWFSGPNPAGLPTIGQWYGDTKIAVADECPGVSVSTCPASNPLKSHFFCDYFTGRDNVKCYARVKQQMLDRLDGKGSPWIALEPYIMLNGAKRCTGVVSLVPYAEDFGIAPDCQ